LSEPRKTENIEHHPIDIGSSDWQEAMDNGKLIKSAPLLLAACEAIQEAFVKDEIKFTKVRQADNDPYHPASVSLSAALAAAKGKSESE
jgi:hypothetical protein